MISSPQGNNSTPTSYRPTEEKTITPVTIRMLQTTTNSSPNQTLSDGRELDQIKIIAAVTKITPTSTAYTYEIEDGTGSIEVKEWVDANDSLMKVQMREEAAKEHQYVRIIGKTQMYDDTLQVVAYMVRKVSSGNELTHHFLEVVESSLKFQKRNRIGGRPMIGGTTSMQGMDMGGGFGGGVMPSNSVPIGQGMNNDGDELKNDILSYLANCKFCDFCYSLSFRHMYYISTSKQI